MRFRNPAVCLYLLSWLAIQPALADIDPAEYEPKTSVRSEKEHQQLQFEFEADKRREQEQQKREEEAAAQRIAAEKAAKDALPYAVRLTQARCTTCHAADYYSNLRHNRIGWELVNLRMQHLNGAQLTAEDRSMIATYLAETYPVTGGAALFEMLMQLAASLSPFWLWIIWRAIRSRAGKMR